MTISKQQLALAAAARLQQLRLAMDFDARKPDSRPTAEQQEALDCICSYKVKNVFVMGGNRSGKSQLLRRLVAWFLREDEEAEWKRRPEWKGPLTGILIAKSHKQLCGSLLEAIIPFFEGDRDFKVIKNGHYVECLQYKKTGNTLWLLVHENTQACRERVQSFAAHMCFLDELPSGGSNAVKLLEEITARVTDHKGVFAAFFTPKVQNRPVKDYVESMSPPAGRKFMLSFLNNPAIDEEAKETRLAEIQALPEHVRDTILTGAWMTSENAVFTLTDNALQNPYGYSPLWSHIVSVDPAINSQMGIVVVAQNPQSGQWFVIYSTKEEKILDVDDAVGRVWNLIRERGYNVLKICYDPASSYWYAQAKKHPYLSKFKITSPFSKNVSGRWEEMVSNLQLSLGTSLFISGGNDELIDEFNSYEWSDTTSGKVKKGQKYHLLDALRYFVDIMPPWKGPAPMPESSLVTAHAQGIRESHEKWKAQEAKRGTTNWRGGGRIVGRGRIQLR